MIGLQTIIDRIAKRKTASAVSADEALDASRVLESHPKNRIAGYRDAAIVGGAGNPLVRAAGRAASAAAAPGSKGKRLAAAAKGFASTDRSQLAQHMTEGVLGGGALKAVQGGLEVGRAKRKIMGFLGQEKKSEQKLAEAFKGTIRKMSDKVTKQKLPPVEAPDFDLEVW